jgi:hypothetical protein
MERRRLGSINRTIYFVKKGTKNALSRHKEALKENRPLTFLLLSKPGSKAVSSSAVGTP